MLCRQKLYVTENKDQIYYIMRTGAEEHSRRAYRLKVQDQTCIIHNGKAEVRMPQLVPELKAYRIMTRRAETEVHMDNDEALILGGLISREEIDNLRKVPLLGNLPVLGRLFRYHYKSNKETELVIIIRSHVVS